MSTAMPAAKHGARLPLMDKRPMELLGVFVFLVLKEDSAEPRMPHVCDERRGSRKVKLLVVALPYI